MFEIKNDSIIDDYIVNSNHTTNCSSKEFQVPEECNCWRVDFAKLILSKQEMKKQIYVSSKVKFASIWKKFRSEGYPIVSSWLDEADKTNTDMTELWNKNIEESGSCGVLVYFAESKDNSISNGGLVEVGSALSNQIPVIWAGPKHPSVWKHKLIQYIDSYEGLDAELEIQIALDRAIDVLKITKIRNFITSTHAEGNKTIANEYLQYIKEKFNPKLNFAFKLKEWKEEQTLEKIAVYLKYFSGMYPGTKYKIDSNGNEYFAFPDHNLLARKWWDILEELRTESIFKNVDNFNALYIWESFVGWCFEDEKARTVFNIGLKDQMEFNISVPDDQKIAHIPSVKCKDTTELSVEITDLSLVKDPTNPIIKTIKLGKSSDIANIPVVQMTTFVNKPKARKLKRIKVHSNYVQCTNKFRRVVSTLTAEITCGHCLKLGKKKGLWV